MIKKFISKKKISSIIKELGKKISEEYKNKNESEIIILSILKGSFIFVADLVREIQVPCKIDFLISSSYSGKTSTGKVKLEKEFKLDLKNKHILILEDIIDTGLSLNFIIAELKKKKPKSIQICTLLLKKNKHKFKYPIDFVGFEIEDEFVIGYGLDYNEEYRNLDYIGILK